MDLDNQNPTTATSNQSSATPDFGAPVDAGSQSAAPSFDMDLINQAAMATSGTATPNPQSAFDVNEISLNDVPTSQQDLDDRLKADPNMSLAGNSDAPVDLGNMVSSNGADASVADPGINAAIDMAPGSAAGGEVAPEPAAVPAATFVDGDIIDNPSDSAATQADSAAMPASSAFDNAAASSFDGSSANIPSPEIIAQPDVVSGLATETTLAPIESAADPIGGPAPAPVDGQVSAATPDPAPASTSDPTSAPVAPAPAPAAPAAQKKGKLPIFIGLGVVVVAAIITAVVLIFVAK